MATERLIIEVSERGTRTVQRNIGQIGERAQRSLEGVNLLKRALAGFAVFEGLRRGIRTLADFEQQMSTVRAITGATDQQFKELRETAKDLGATTRFSASQAAEGLTFLARAGFDVQQSIDTIDDTLRLAQAGALDLGSAADIATNILTGFRLETDQAARVVDVLAFTANNANTDVLQLGEAMKFVAPVAAGVGVSIEEASAAIAKLSDAGLQGSLAGTGLRRVLSELESPASRTLKLFEQLGIRADEVRVSNVGLTAALERLRDAGVDTALGLEIFGDRGGPAFEILRNAIPDVINMAGELENAGGTAERIAAVMDDNLNGALLSLKSAAEAVVLALGELGATSILTSIVRGLADAVRFLANNVEILSGFLSGLGVLILPRVVTGMRALSAALLANPFAVLVVGISTAIGALNAFADEIKISEDGLATLADVGAEASLLIQEAFAALGDFLGSVFDAVSPELAAFFGEFDLSLRGILETTGLVFDAFVGIVSGSIASVVSVFQSIPGAVGTVFRVALNFVVDFINDAIRFVIRGLNELLARIQELSREVPGITLNLPTVTAPQLPRVAGEFQNSFDEIGRTAGDAFNIALEKSTLGRDTVEGILARAEERARARAADIAAPADTARATIPEPVDVGGAAARDAIDGSGAANENTARAVSLLERMNEQLRLEQENLGLSAVQRQRLAQSRQLDNDLIAAGVDLATSQGQILADQVERAGEELQVLQRKSALLEELRGPEEERLQKQMDLNALVADGLISQEEYNQAIRDLGPALNQSGTALDGFRGRLNSIDTSLQSFGDQLGGTALSAVDGFAGAITDLVTSGLSDFESFKDALSNIFAGIGQDILKLVVRFLILKAIQSTLGGLGGDGGIVSGIVGGVATNVATGATQGALQGRQAGGPVTTGTPFVVGERGPELFVPTQAGNIVPNGAAQGGEAPQVNIVNVTDPNEVTGVINSQEGSEAIVNVVSKNARQIKQVLGV